jgi:hypothetical protein
LSKTLSSMVPTTGVCTGVTYTMTYSSGAAIDTSVFTFTTAPLAVAVTTYDETKAGSYTLLLVGTLTGDTITSSSTIAVTINSACYG